MGEAAGVEGAAAGSSRLPDGQGGAVGQRVGDPGGDRPGGDRRGPRIGVHAAKSQHAGAALEKRPHPGDHSGVGRVCHLIDRQRPCVEGDSGTSGTQRAGGQRPDGLVAV